MVSDSKVGENSCLIYRGQRINQRVMRYAYYASQIKNTNLINNKKFNFRYGEATVDWQDC